MYYQVAGTNLRILGSIHLLPPGTADLPRWSWEAFNWAEALVLEHNIASAVSLLRYSDGRRLSTQISPANFAAISAIWSRLQIQEPLEEFKPWAANLWLAGKASNPVAGVEPRFIAAWSNLGRRIEYLESPEVLFANFDAVSINGQERATSILLQHFADLPRNQAALAATWISRDQAAFEQTLQRSPLNLVPELRDAMFGNRNRAWMTPIAALAASSSRTLVCMGAGHLFGDDGVIALLRSAGQTVTEIPYPNGSRP
jgi:uncharacterized protein